MSHFLSQAEPFLPILMQGVYLTVLVTLGAFVLATGLGLVWAFMRVSGIAPLAWTARTIIVVVRGIPGMVTLFYIYFVMPDLGLSLTALQAAIIGLGIAYSPYMAEVFRAGIEAIDRGQTEAALSIGMGWSLLMRRVVLPQAIRVALPPTAARWSCCSRIPRSPRRSRSLSSRCRASCWRPRLSRTPRSSRSWR